VGFGTLAYTGDNSTNNTYTGLTNVTAGVLQLSKTAGGTAISGNLTVGSPTPGSSTYRTQTQTLTFNNFTNASTQQYSLSFAGQKALLPAYVGDLTTDASNIQAALNSMASGLGMTGNPFTVTAVSATVFNVTFTGVTNPFNGTAWPQIVGFRDP